MIERDRRALADLLAACTASLLATFGGGAERVEAEGAPPDGPALAAVGFVGRQISGTLFFDASRGLLARTYPVTRPGGPAEGDLCDWSGEFANLLLGLLKRELGERGVSIRLGTPIVAAGGRRGTYPPPVGGERLTCQFEGGGARARAWLDLTSEPLFELAPTPPSPSAERRTDSFWFD